MSNRIYRGEWFFNHTSLSIKISTSIHG